MAYIHQAHAALIEKLTKLRPADMPYFPGSDDFEARLEQTKEFAGAVDEYLHALAIDTAENSGLTRRSGAYRTILHDALTDNCFYSDLDDCADDVREPGRSDFDEHNTLHRRPQPEAAS